MIGVIKSLTKPVTTAPKAMPMTMPTAMSTRLPLSKKVLKPLPIPPSPFIFAACLTCNASLISPSPLFSRHRLIWGPAAGRIDKTQELALAAPQQLDHLLPLGPRLLVVECRSGKFGDGSVQVGKLKDAATGKLEWSLAQLRLPLRKSFVCLRKRVGPNQYRTNSCEG